VEISVIGHTDRVGKLEANDALSLKRAEAVGEQLKAAGILAPMEFAGRGEREPLIPTADEVPEPANRRVEINLR
jgi:outer membrane protein OmpA-like peptidoglycan-associated protein